MDCDRYSQELADYVRGKLQDDKVSELETHISACDQCRTEADDLRWFLTGVKNNQAVIREGHLSSPLMYEYVDDSSILDRETTGRVESHLDGCETCRQDRDRIAEMIALELSHGETAAATTTHRTHWLSWPRLRTAFASLASVLVIVSFVWIFVTLTGKPDYDVSLVSDPGELHTVDVALSDVVRGDSDTTPVVRLGEIEQRQIVLRIKVDVFEGDAIPAAAVIDNAAGDTVWSHAIEDPLASSDAVLIRIDKSTFPTGRYVLEIIDSAGASMGRAVVDFE